MSVPSQPAHLSNHQRSTLRQIFQHPAGHNIEWRAVLSLLAAVGSAEERHDGKFAVTIGAQTEYFEPPRHKDISTQAVVNLRRMLTQTGYGAGAAKPPAESAP
jgi:thiamine biosynthesis lipoprotein ApbE